MTSSSNLLLHLGFSPFSGILGMLSLLKDSSGLSHEQFEFVDMAKASCEMLIRIVDDLLNFSKLEADKVTLEDIPLCFEEILGGNRDWILYREPYWVTPILPLFSILDMRHANSVSIGLVIPFLAI
jgi:hypothetical protein